MSHKIFEILRALDSAGLHYRISRHRDDTILVSVTAVGERLEIDVFEDGHIEFCRFCGSEMGSADEAEFARWVDLSSS